MSNKIYIFNENVIFEEQSVEPLEESQCNFLFGNLKLL